MRRVSAHKSARLQAYLLATAGLIILGDPARAQQSEVPDTTTVEDDGGASIDESAEAPGDEIVVTARREAENAQDVPLSLQVVSGDNLQKLAITQPVEISKLTPGLSLQLPEPDSPTIVLRGVRWVQSSGIPAIPVYLNEIAFDPALTLQTLYDVGQIEVLRGPQGTSRGAPSVAGAITITTRRPDLQEFGGFGYLLAGSRDHVALQGALNIPIIRDMLALRVAGQIEDTNGNGVRSLNSPQDPTVKNRSSRVSLRFEPTGTLLLDGTWQRVHLNGRFYRPVEGSGTNGLTDFDTGSGPMPPMLNPLAPPGYNIAGVDRDGPRSIAARDYRSAQEFPDIQFIRQDLFMVNASWEVLGQRLSYNYGLQRVYDTSKNNVGSSDPANILVGYDDYFISRNLSRSYRNWHEVRLSSVREKGRFFDYDVGYYRETSGADANFELIGSLFPGAFGNPFTSPPNPFANPAAVNRYALRTESELNLSTRSWSIYGNAQLHLPYNIEFSGGLRFINDKRPLGSSFALNDAFIVATPNFGFPCAFIPSPIPLVDSPIYPGFCDAALSQSNGTLPSLPPEFSGRRYKPTIYNGSLSKKFGEDLLVYATVGSSWRQALPAIGNFGLPSDLVTADPEESTSYELGVKADPAPGIRVSAAIFQIDYDGQITNFEGVPYLRTDTGELGTTSPAFNFNVDAQVRGVEAEIVVQPIERLNLAANFSYAKIESEGGLVPCRNDAVPLTPTNRVNFCPLPEGETLNSAPQMQFSVNGGYTVPFGSFDGYVRFIVAYQGRNPAFGISNDDFNAKAHTLVDLFAGLTGDRDAWDFGAYAKNLFNVKRVLTRSEIENTFAPDFGPSGLDELTLTPRREIGVTLRYAFGSR